MMSLLEILTKSKATFSVRERLELAHRLSLAMLQLHSTPWMQNNWHSRDILLLEETATASTTSTANSNQMMRMWPYVSAAFNDLERINSMQVCENDKFRSSYVRSLGVVLIEIGLANPLDNTASMRAADDMTKWLKACKEVNMATVAAVMGKDYHLVVERCVLWSIQNDDLEDETVQRNFYEDVALRLKGCLQEYDRAFII
ncbi:hypothetical protein AA313_de0207205 [Arthrobotrys entomopaga]|nr:hypothetical protein AA313_de0207205 [Arthrobotrys entomopaga]